MNVQNEIVVGIDIGSTSAVCILDKNLSVLFLKSKKEYKISEMIDDIIRFGKPLLISCDVSRIPKKILKIARSLGTKIFHPKEDVREEKKIKITKNYSYNNWHERDAIFSAIIAMKFLRRKLFGKKVKIKENFPDKKIFKENKKEKIYIKNKIDVKKLIEKIKILKEENKKLKKLLEEMKEKKIVEKKVIDFKEIKDKKLELENEALRTVIEILKLSLEEDEIPYVKLEEINKDFLEIIKKYINNFVIISNQIEKFYILEEIGVEYVITDNEVENIWNLKVIFDKTSKYEKIGKIKLEHLKNRWKEKLLKILK